MADLDEEWVKALAQRLGDPISQVMKSVAVTACRYCKCRGLQEFYRFCYGCGQRNPAFSESAWNRVNSVFSELLQCDHAGDAILPEFAELTPAEKVEFVHENGYCGNCGVKINYKI